MTDLEFEEWKLARGRGLAVFVARGVVRKWAVFATPLAITLWVACLWPGKDPVFWRHAGLLATVFLAVTWALGCGEALVGWRRRESEYTRKTGFLADWDKGSARRTRISPGPSVERPAGLFPDDSLIDEARSWQTAHTRGLIDLDEKCARFDPIFRTSLAKDTFSLAGRARVDEKAAFLALMAQYEN